MVLNSVRGPTGDVNESRQPVVHCTVIYRLHSQYTMVWANAVGKADGRTNKSFQNHSYERITYGRIVIAMSA